MEAVRWAWRTKLRFSTELDMKMRLWQIAEDEAVKVFAGNLRDLLLAAPAGARATLGLDPGYRTGVKVAVVDATGKVVATDTIYPHEPRRQWDEALAVSGSPVPRACGRARGHRQRHRLPRDRQARGRAGGEERGSAPDQGHGVGGRRLRLFGLGLCEPGAAGPRRLHTRCGLHRTAPAGPAGGTREDRSEIHRRRPVPARPRGAQALPVPRRGGGGLRQRCRRRSQHRLGAAPVAGLGTEHLGGPEHRRASGRPRPVPDPQGLVRRHGPRTEDLRAGGGLPAHSRTETIPSMRPACIRRPTRSCGASWTRRRATSRC